ncbi:AmmeMemoRadiSam system protein B [Actinobaculum sp. 313]|uniref:AmmeMemoRadiSam system protein B n=1 Tax=Actinobaculum sp. 313 TaxID=2495645 RepID=UPI000D525E71|nr:AmmeMemoRadiSam system protein B [Actinobaculum sp. 313]AWE43277.1 AmmeMemoRadiSam system protein B [Actinobaculum sp. 313]
MVTVRQPAVAGLFYPHDAQECRASVRECLDFARQNSCLLAAPPHAIIAPHAGYVYSGLVAGLAYRQLEPLRGQVTRAVVMGPAHRVPVRGIACSEADAMATPLGVMPVAREAEQEVARCLPQLVPDSLVHAQEHSVEVHLPFLQEVLGDIEVIPLVAGDVSIDDVAAVWDAFWGDDETVVVASSDLSHYHSYAQAQRIDRGTIGQILDGDCAINHFQACGATPMNGLLLAAQRRGLMPRLLGMCNSGDVAPDRSRVVGYAALALVGDAYDDVVLDAEAQVPEVKVQSSNSGTPVPGVDARALDADTPVQERNPPARKSNMQVVDANAPAPGTEGDASFQRNTEGENND